MWSRKFLKNRAKAVLKVSYLKAFLVSLVIAIVGGRDVGSFHYNWNLGNHNFQYGFNSVLRQNIGMFPFWGMFLKGVFIVIPFVLALRVFLGYSLEVSGRRYFVQSTQYDIDINYLGYSFGKEKYFNIIKTMLWRSILTFLWYLLLIVPGIVKSYAYRMVPYILTDNPNIGYRRAIELSDKMTKGEKIDMWILDLSFIGWYLLGALLFQVGVFFVMPYENTTKAELYLVLRKNALDYGFCSDEELGLKSTLYTEK